MRNRFWHTTSLFVEHEGNLLGFGGVGEVIPGGSQILKSNNLLPAGGGGVRFQLSKKYRVNLRADIAQGRDTWTWSMGVGEAF